MAKNKTLILVRHAKSSWSDSTLNDIQRPLNKRGNKDAPKMGKHLAKKNLIPQAIFSSSGLRALTTARLISVELGMKPIEIIVEDDLYTFDSEQLLDVIKTVPDEYEKIMVVGHNPAVTDITNILSGSEIDNIPTCGVAILKLSVDSWKDIGKNTAKLSRFDYPKKLW